MSSLQQNWRKGQKQVLSGNEVVEGKKKAEGGSGEKWPKQCVYI
jgi:hypothetical protein